MSKHDREKHSAGEHHEHYDKTAARQWHKSWLTWTVVGLMLAAMAVYVLSLDNEIVPGEPVQPRVPAAE
jgi:hypothetical protein